ncbi:hypothetical protein TSOC_005773 [Tetrabaena socialis]|uniref:Uncharacterized protein n=1 Tax=Tetrabaena socialis TaxID=47790 RepID=A0A2J8A5G3_9CHLO|nr:hypothetical protein TSOC_005773 [Tetrabaena socialis]|eukprot:PNH07745.1 hypothetical protein TSOC_005773 [Tetrabaena socialis]
MAWGGSKKPDALAGLTKETQDLLSGVMKDRGLSQRALQDVASSIQRGDSAWVGHLNSGTAAFQAPRSKAAQLVKAPKVGGGGPLAPPLPGRFGGKKLQGEILRDSPAERDMFVGGAPVTDREAEKDRLSKVIVDEVRERLTFLESMKAMGRGGEYEVTIRAEVAARLRELEKLGVPIK